MQPVSRERLSSRSDTPDVSAFLAPPKSVERGFSSQKPACFKRYTGPVDAYHCYTLAYPIDT
uniref:Uncharacterized protein n=1 Tax=Coccidioides posadasii RMSCC 3488 TaxID=454284 RepID=A0A0J6IIG0_COCPO|nr:hypothetical protein CPAG_07935 [Coccidioides posadasii RMSCC 3488]